MNFEGACLRMHSKKVIKKMCSDFLTSVRSFDLKKLLQNQKQKERKKTTDGQATPQDTGEQSCVCWASGKGASQLLESQRGDYSAWVAWGKGKVENRLVLAQTSNTWGVDSNNV